MFLIGLVGSMVMVRVGNSASHNSMPENFPVAARVLVREVEKRPPQLLMVLRGVNAGGRNIQTNRSCEAIFPLEWQRTLEGRTNIPKLTFIREVPQSNSKVAKAGTKALLCVQKEGFKAMDRLLSLRGDLKDQKRVSVTI